MNAYILALILLLAPRRNPLAVAPIVEAIAAHATTPEEARVMVALEYHENGLTPTALYPFGTTCCRDSRHNWMNAARHARNIVLRGHRICGNWEGAFRFYNTGMCLGNTEPVTPVAQRVWREGRTYGWLVSGSFRRLRRIPVPSL